MNLRSIRFRLTLWYSLAFFIGTAVIFVSFYLITKQTLLSHTDSRIISHGKALVKIVGDKQIDMVTGVFNQGIIAQQFSEMPGMLVLVTDSSGQLVASSQAGADENPVIKDLVEKSAGVVKSTFIERTIGTTILRIGVFPIVRDGKTTGLVFMGDPIETIYRSLNSLLLVFLAIYGLMFIPTIFGVHLLSKSAMFPVTQISQKLKNVSSNNLDERIPIPNTKDEIAELANTFNSLLERLAQAFKRERQFIGDVTHEMKTPLSTLRSSAEISLSKERTNEEYKKVLSGTLIDVDRLSNTIDNVLDLAWSEADRSKTMKDVFNLSDLVSEILDLTNRLAEERNVKVSGHITPKISIHGRRDKVMRAIINIVDNAVKYTPKKGKIDIGLKIQNQQAILQITDTGVGIAKEELPNVFQRFYRGAKTEKTFGSGLGLAISRAIITAHSGTIELESTQGKGTKVTIKFPHNV